MALPEMAARIAGLSVILLCAVTILAYALQRTLIYYPETADFRVLEPHAARKGLLPWLGAEGNFIGWRSRQGVGAPVLVLHGNAGHSLHRSYFVSRLHDAKVTPPIYILEYPGYGARPGQPTESNLVAATVKAIDLLDQPAILIGESLGTGVACAAASQRPRSVRGFLLITPFDSLIAVARKHYPWAPVNLILQDRYESSHALKKLRAPLAIIVAENDAVVPVDSAIRLFESYFGPKKLWRVPGSGHNDVLDDISDAELRAAYEFANGR
jgi:pimeloyl-ACP methyl ester carboxylesterase